MVYIMAQKAKLVIIFQCEGIGKMAPASARIGGSLQQGWGR